MLKVGQLVDKANDWQIIHGVGNLERYSGTTKTAP